MDHMCREKPGKSQNEESGVIQKRENVLMS
jgi:hypothetical protein